MRKSYYWIVAWLILVVVFGTIYAVVQQAQRTQANWPQIQLAEDAAAQLDAGKSFKSVVGSNFDISDSLAPFINIYDRQGRVLAGSGELHGRLVVPPVGILQQSDHKPYHWVSWQPNDQTRVAAVTVSAENYYVLSGRNLREVEKNESLTFQLAFAGGVLASVILLVGYRLGRKSH